ncbi:hypothetical protein HK099_002573, partial [Clydaea vesicula]
MTAEIKSINKPSNINHQQHTGLEQVLKKGTNLKPKPNTRLNTLSLYDVHMMRSISSDRGLKPSNISASL